MVKNKGKVSIWKEKQGEIDCLLIKTIKKRVVNPEEEERTTLKTINVNSSLKKKDKVKNIYKNKKNKDKQIKPYDRICSGHQDVG
jgi:hypothetical protein